MVKYAASEKLIVGSLAVLDATAEERVGVLEVEIEASASDQMGSGHKAATNVFGVVFVLLLTKRERDESKPRAKLEIRLPSLDCNVEDVGSAIGLGLSELSKSQSIRHDYL